MHPPSPVPRMQKMLSKVCFKSSSRIALRGKIWTRFHTDWHHLAHEIHGGGKQSSSAGCQPWALTVCKRIPQSFFRTIAVAVLLNLRDILLKLTQQLIYALELVCLHFKSQLHHLLVLFSFFLFPFFFSYHRQASIFSSEKEKNIYFSVGGRNNQLMPSKLLGQFLVQS